MYKGLRRGLSGQNACCANKRARVQIPSTHIKSWAWQLLPLTRCLFWRGHSCDSRKKSLATSLVKTSFFIALKVLKNGPLNVLLVSKLILLFYCAVALEPGVSWILGKHSATELSPRSPQINSKTKLHVSSKGLKKFNLNIFKKRIQ